VLDSARGARLEQTWRLWSALQQTLRACVGADFTPADAPPPLRARIAQLCRVADFEAAQARIAELQTAVRADFVALVGPVERAKS
jgi:hypothetical protein